jgi:mannose-6-phosphate isomerase-like protein (cupin superfamily)
VRTVPKPWGHELIFAETERYAGKILHLEPGQSLSLQYHDVLNGEVSLSVDVDGEMKEIRLPAGSAYRVRPGVRHRMHAQAACDLIEVSSPELDDIVRLEDAYGRAGTTAP